MSSESTRCFSRESASTWPVESMMQHRGVAFSAGTERHGLHDRLGQGFPIEDDAQHADQRPVGQSALPDAARVDQRRLRVDQLRAMRGLEAKFFAALGAFRAEREPLLVGHREPID